MEFVVIRRSVGAPVDENKQVSVCISHAVSYTHHTILYGYGCREREEAQDHPHHTHRQTKHNGKLPTQLILNDELKQTAEEDRAELTNYDAKVYKASRQMSDAMIAELKALRIPFFTIKKGLVLDSDPSNMGRTTTTTAPTVKQQQQQLSREELSALQLRMLELLQDLCRE